MNTAIAIDALETNKPWLVMVHGMSQDHRIFSGQTEAFRSSHRLLLVDLPGHGLAGGVGGPFGHVEFAQHVSSVLDDHSVRDACYWGTHTGATVGLLLAATRPDLITTLVCEGPVIPGENPPAVKDLIAGARNRLANNGLEAALGHWWENSSWFDRMRADPGRCRAEQHREIVMNFGGAPWRDDAPPAPVVDVRTKLGRIACPTLIYNGEYDHADFLAAAEEIASLIPNAKRQLIPDTGGFPAWESPQAVNLEVATFLAAAVN
jgi:3-oxoadipate enol-lactonase